MKEKRSSDQEGRCSEERKGLVGRGTRGVGSEGTGENIS